jgi:hypothetical protein
MLTRYKNYLAHAFSSSVEHDITKCNQCKTRVKNDASHILSKIPLNYQETSLNSAVSRFALLLNQRDQDSKLLTNEMGCQLVRVFSRDIFENSLPLDNRVISNELKVLTRLVKPLFHLIIIIDKTIDLVTLELFQNFLIHCHKGSYVWFVMNSNNDGILLDKDLTEAFVTICNVPSVQQFLDFLKLQSGRVTLGKIEQIIETSDIQTNFKTDFKTTFFGFG